MAIGTGYLLGSWPVLGGAGCEEMSSTTSPYSTLSSRLQKNHRALYSILSAGGGSPLPGNLSKVRQFRRLVHQCRDLLDSAEFEEAEVVANEALEMEDEMIDDKLRLNMLTFQSLAVELQDRFEEANVLKEQILELSAKTFNRRDSIDTIQNRIWDETAEPDPDLYY